MSNRELQVIETKTPDGPRHAVFNGHDVIAVFKKPEDAQSFIHWNADERELRMMLFLRHGCGFADLYFDDGEMQCNHCRIDFKRDSGQKIAERFHQIGINLVGSLGLQKLLDIPKP